MARIEIPMSVSRIQNGMPQYSWFVTMDHEIDYPIVDTF